MKNLYYLVHILSFTHSKNKYPTATPESVVSWLCETWKTMMTKVKGEMKENTFFRE